ncbi:uncharacterized protein LOC116297770 isoform X2 [Actinia tenebrosa]|uniref:Uncharacterized protein LOC116297770 isoform X2 n=1 Tax=Actinia tenebrosa TaxID=6105 RepID=A0A6P8IB09_ACTTE|nr:uncharacterized protein LOC116297770 isoform X2 [Actinia tenebrosa]
MLTVSLVGKKFSCNIQLKIFAEKDGGGLELALKAGEKCSNRPQAISNVTANLNITIQRGCNNYVTKCKEMLMFLQEQALPKTMNIIKVHMVNREAKALQKDEASRLFSCIRPSKRDRDRLRERSASRDRLSTRGYSSDSEQLYRHSQGSSTDITSRQSNKTDIIATPRMSRHRLKNAALLRDRKQREASKDRNDISEKENEEQKTKVKNTSMEIHLPVRENKKNKEKRYSVRSFDTEGDSQGEFIYDGGSESSLRAQVIEDKENEGARDIVVKKDKSTENLEKNRETTDRKISVTDSDMSVDSLECLDLSSKEIQEKKKKKKRKARKRVEENLTSKEDVTSSPSAISQMPSLALPEDFQDSSVENSDNCILNKEHEKTFKTNSTLRRDSSDGLTTTNIPSDLAKRIVADIVCSALKKCGKPTQTEFKNLDNNLNEGQKCTGGSVHSGGSIADDVIEGTPSLEHAEIKLEFIEDNSSVEVESKDGKLLTTTDNENIGDQKCRDASCVTVEKENILVEASNDDKVESKTEVKRLDDEENSVVTVDKSNQEIPKIPENNDAGAMVEQEDVPKDSLLLQNISGQIKTQIQETLDPEKRCSTEMLVTEDAKTDESSSKHATLDSEITKTNGNPDSSSVSKSMESNEQDNSGNSETMILSPEVETRDREGGQETAVSKSPHIRLYDTHVNITNRIINSVSQVLHLQTQYTTPTQSNYLTFDPDIPLAYYTTPEQGFEGLLNKELFMTASNNQQVSDGRPENTKGTEIKKEKSRRNLRDHEKFEETFQRFLQGQRFRSSDGGDSARSTKDGYQDSSSDAAGVNTSYINTTSGSDPHKGYCYFVVGSDSTDDAPQNFERYSNNPRVSTDEEREDLDTTPVLEPRGRRHGERPKSGVYHRSISEQNERKRWITAIQEPDLLRTVHQRSSSADTRRRVARNNKCMSCPVLSEEDIILEGMESHHKDVCNSLSQRTWIILRVHELWKAKKQLEALKMCMELTGIKAADSTAAEGMQCVSNPDITGNKDNTLFLNILQQLPSSCSTWSLSMCDLLLPELKVFISSRRHTSHVEMACNVLQVIVKKVSSVVLKVQKENKEKPDLLKNCVAHLRDVSDRISQVLVARRGKIHTALTTEDPIALKPVLRDLLSTIQTLLRVYVE